MKAALVHTGTCFQSYLYLPELTTIRDTSIDVTGESDGTSSLKASFEGKLRMETVQWTNVKFGGRLVESHNLGNSNKKALSKEVLWLPIHK